MSKKQLLFSAKGRLSRKNYWRGYFLNFIFFILPLIIIFGFLGAISIVGAVTAEPQPDPKWVVFITSKNGKALAALFSLPLLVCCVYTSFCISIKRLHDLNYNGWLSLYKILPLIFFFSSTAITLASLASIILTISLCFFKGTNGPNKYGDDPLLK